MTHTHKPTTNSAIVGRMATTAPFVLNILLATAVFESGSTAYAQEGNIRTGEDEKIHVMHLSPPGQNVVGWDILLSIIEHRRVDLDLEVYLSDPHEDINYPACYSELDSAIERCRVVAADTLPTAVWLRVYRYDSPVGETRYSYRATPLYAPLITSSRESLTRSDAVELRLGQTVSKRFGDQPPGATNSGFRHLYLVPVSSSAPIAITAEVTSSRSSGDPGSTRRMKSDLSTQSMKVSRLESNIRMRAFDSQGRPLRATVQPPEPSSVQALQLSMKPPGEVFVLVENVNAVPDQYLVSARLAEEDDFDPELAFKLAEPLRPGEGPRLIYDEETHFFVALEPKEMLLVTLAGREFDLSVYPRGESIGATSARMSPDNSNMRYVFLGDSVDLSPHLLGPAQDYTEFLVRIKRNPDVIFGRAALNVESLSSGRRALPFAFQGSFESALTISPSDTTTVPGTVEPGSFLLYDLNLDELWFTEVQIDSDSDVIAGLMGEYGEVLDIGSDWISWYPEVTGTPHYLIVLPYDLEVGGDFALTFSR